MKLKKVVALIMCLTMIISSFGGMSVVIAQENKYVMFGTSYGEKSISLNTVNGCINGDLLANGNIEKYGNINYNGKDYTVNGEQYYFAFDKIQNMFFENNYDIYNEDMNIIDMNINFNTATITYGKTYLEGNLSLNSAIESMQDVVLTGNNLNANNALIMSKYGNIEMDYDNVSVTGLIYAPFGKVVINATNCNLNNVVVIAQNIEINCSNLNANYNYNIGNKILGESEQFYCDLDEWKYLKDENENNIPDLFENPDEWDKLKDTDNDGLVDVFEDYLDGDRFNTDTDGDGLDDYYESFMTFTKLNHTDSDDNGITDDIEDLDEDGLSNIIELETKTHPWNEDTDDDGIIDGDESNIHNSNPLVKDTDNDGLIESDELKLGTEILNKDTDGDGILDGDEEFIQEYSVETDEDVISNISVEMQCAGNIERTTEIESVLGEDVLTSNVVGLVGCPYEITSSSEFESATISYKISEDYLKDNSIKNLAFMWYDEENNMYVPLKTEYDEENGVVKTTTSHFSVYLLVDIVEWITAWAERINYGNEVDISYNTVLAIDCSGSMAANDPIIKNSNGNIECNRVAAGTNYIWLKYGNEKISILTFDSEVDVLTPLTNNRIVLTNSLQKIYSKGDTNINSAISKALEQFSQDDFNNNKVVNRIILLSDGEYTKEVTYARRAKSNGVAIHTVGLGDDSDDVMLKELAEFTGGKFMKALSAEELVDIYTEFGFEELDTTDTDGDGLFDVVERNGIKVQNGAIIRTNPYNPDTDYDGLLDGEEINPEMQDAKDYICYGDNWEMEENIRNMLKSGNRYYFYMYSDPNVKDSDNDGYTDYEELKEYNSNPMSCDVKEYYLDNSYVSVRYEGEEEYEKKNGWYKGTLSYGGNQSWFYDKKKKEGNKTIEDAGCGLIAMADLFLYFSKKDNNYESALTDLCEHDKKGIYEYESYLNYVKVCEPLICQVHFYGILGTDLAKGIDVYLENCGNEYDAKWGMSKDDIKPRIWEMLKNDIPVILSVGPAFNDDLFAYVKQKDSYNITSASITRHFMVVTGYIKDRIQKQEWLQVSSWGKEYYIAYDEYVDFIESGTGRNITSNIVYIEEK